MFDESEINERMFEEYEIEDEKKIREKEEKNEPQELKELRKKIVKDLNLINSKLEMNLYNIFMNRFMDLKKKYENISGTEL